ncbi:Sec-independent protein translocase protein TatB [Alphaproteobacteria bacterium SO-S41]|nr:Sec-independent protein translocase protein TatB [Alphaproteobacteria bacterium SO-S41]
MFDLAWSEILVIAVVAILVVGPKDLPRMMKTVGQWVGKARRMAAHFQSGVDEMIRQAELEDLRKDLAAMKRDMNAPMRWDPATSTTPPPDHLMVQSDEPKPAPLPLPPPIEHSILPPAPAEPAPPAATPEKTTP